MSSVCTTAGYTTWLNWRCHMGSSGKRCQIVYVWGKRNGRTVVVGQCPVQPLAPTALCHSASQLNSQTMEPKTNMRHDFDANEAYGMPGQSMILVALVRDRLYSERTLNADQMRDLAERLRLALEASVQLDLEG